MPAPLSLEPPLTEDEATAYYESSVDPVEMRRWLVVLWKVQGKKHSEIARLLQRTPAWVTQVIRIYNERGPDRMSDQRAHNGNEALLNEADGERLIAILKEDPPQGGVWTGLKLKAWIEENLEVEQICLQAVYDTLHRLGISWKLPRPHHTKSDTDAQEALKKGDLQRRWSR